MELPTRFRTVVVLCDLEGLGYVEAAASLKIPIGTLQSRLARVRRIPRDNRILDNLPERALERTDDEFRVNKLVDPVPVLVEGVWKGLDVERLVAHLRDGKLVDPLREIDQPKKINRARPPVLMLRTFDFTLEAGKIYRYRARLVFSAPPEIRQKTRRTTIPGPWSEPTAPVEVR